MKPEIHPTYYPEAHVTCASCGTVWVTGSTRKEVRVDTCSKCHPFFTGEASRLLDIEGQVDRFYKKLQARQTHVEAKQARETSKKSPERVVGDLELSTRATEALKKGGIDTVGQLLEKLAQGDEAVLAVAGFGRSSLTAAKKKLRALGYDVPEAAAT
ncbi:MAG TPA: 50S ribosomal protein L31 [Anaerolineales bacterium]|jgi:large subunit ribosomal protein L31